MLNPKGQTGVIATNSLAQGKSRAVALDQIVASGARIRRAVRSASWPAKSADVEYCAIWTSIAPIERGSMFTLDGKAAKSGITASLYPESRVPLWGEPLARNRNLSFVGSKPLSEGFVIDETNR